MASATQIKELLKTHGEGNDERFYAIAMQVAVAEAYSWDDLDLGHGFHETKQGIRFTISEEARREVLQRLLKLNHERYEEEVKAGLHDKKAKKSTSRKGGRKQNIDKTIEFDL